MSDDQEAFKSTAEAIKSVSDTASKAMDLVTSVVKPEVAQAAIGLAGGDWLVNSRRRNKARLETETHRVIERLKIDPVEPAPDVANKILEAAFGENREELQDLWAALLAASMDPKRRNDVGSDFIEIAKRLTPLDVRLLKWLTGEQIKALQEGSGDAVALLAEGVEATNDQAHVSLDRLKAASLVIAWGGDKGRTRLVELTSLGREFLRCVRGHSAEGE